MRQFPIVLFTALVALSLFLSCSKEEEPYLPSQGVPKNRYDPEVNRRTDVIEVPLPPKSSPGDRKRAAEEIAADFLEAVKAGNGKAVDALIEEGASVDAVDEHGISAWEWASFYNNETVMVYLKALAVKRRDTCFDHVGQSMRETDHFTVLSKRGAKPALMIAEASERFLTQFAGAFAPDLPNSLKDNRVLIRFFATRKAFADFVASRGYWPDMFGGVQGIYRPDDRIVYYFWQGDRENEIMTLRHELAHAFLHAVNTSLRIPSWLDEGFAVYMTLGGYRDGRIQHVKHSQYLYWTRRYLKKYPEKWMPVSRFMRMPPRTFYGERTTVSWHYLQAWGILYLLADGAGKGRGTKLSRLIRFHFHPRPEEGEAKQNARALKECFGCTPEEVDRRAEKAFR